MNTQKVTISIPQQQLEACYFAANAELNNDFDVTTKDGLEDESW